MIGSPLPSYLVLEAKIPLYRLAKLEVIEALEFLEVVEVLEASMAMLMLMIMSGQLWARLQAASPRS